MPEPIDWDTVKITSSLDDLPSQPGIGLRFYFGDADIQCECGWHCHGDSANVAWGYWYAHQVKDHPDVFE